MTPRAMGEILGFLTGQIIVLVCVWVVLVAIALIIGKLIRRTFSLRDAVRSGWVIGITAMLFIVLLVSAMGRR